jgi:hypothetical protein
MFQYSEGYLMNPFIEDKFDEKFKEYQPQLHWLPWVGKNYLQCPSNKKLLIVGESHYVPENENAEDGYDAETWTRMFILKEGLKQEPWINRNAINPLIKNTEKAIFWDDDEASDEFKRKLWSSVAYFNIIQRLLNSINSRPSEEDWNLGWETFIKVIEILSPDFVLFCGVEASNQIASLNAALFNSNLKTEGIKRYAKIGNTYPRTATITHDNVSIPIIFIKHPSRCFPVHLWGEFLDSQMAGYSNWICKEE